MTPGPRLSDTDRIMIGEVPVSFVLEASIRMVILYMLLLVGLRLMGKRMAGQLSRTELAALVTAAAAIGIPILSPDRGLLAAVVIVAVVVLGQRMLAHAAARHLRVEAWLEGIVITVVADGRLCPDAMAHAVLSSERVFAQLRGSGLEHLGQVRRLYMEANGTFSLVEEKEHPGTGLSLLPSWDEDFRRLQPVAAGTLACRRCGDVVRGEARPCPRCGQSTWEPAVTRIPDRPRGPGDDPSDAEA